MEIAITIIIAVAINLAIFGSYLALHTLKQRFINYLIRTIQKEILKYMNDK